MLENVFYKRTDGTYVGTVNGLPYHILQSDPLYQEAQLMGAEAPFEPTPVQPTIEQQRELMICSPAQMRLTLLNIPAGEGITLLDVVNNIAASNPQANIVWQYAKMIYRNSPFIEQLLTNPVRAFTEEEVDGIFIAAMGLQI